MTDRATEFEQRCEVAEERCIHNALLRMALNSLHKQMLAHMRELQATIDSQSQQTKDTQSCQPTPTTN